MTPLRLGLSVAAGAIAVDQATKWWILTRVMDPPRVIEVLPVFNLVLTWNRGISFGLFNTGSAANAWILSALALVIVALLLVWLRRAAGRMVPLALGLIIGGALGNVIDRMVHRAVVDFLDLHWGPHHWPAFNAADSFITVGAALLIADSLFAGRGRQSTIK